MALVVMRALAGEHVDSPLDFKGFFFLDGGGRPLFFAFRKRPGRGLPPLRVTC